MASTNYLKENLPQLNGATVENVNNGGYRIKLRSVAVVECKNATEMLSSLNLMVRGETVLSGKFVKAEELNEFNKFKTELEIHRKVLGFNENEEITPEKLKLRYRELAKKCHSDRGGNDAMMAEINLAHEFYTQNLARINNLPNEALRISQLQNTSTKSNPTTPTEANSNTPVVFDSNTQARMDKVLQPGGKTIIPPPTSTVQKFNPISPTEANHSQIEGSKITETSTGSSPASPNSSFDATLTSGWTREKVIEAIKNLVPKGQKLDGTDIRAFIEAVPNMDMANIDLYLKVIKSAIEFKISEMPAIIANGYLSSSEGAEMFLELKKRFPYDSTWA